MAQLFYNPFSSNHLWTPVTQRDAYDQYCQSQGTDTHIDQKPFPRKVDFWFAALSVAAWKELQPMDMKDIGERANFIQGSIFDSDNWRVHAIMLIAIATEDDVAIVEKPRRMMQIANRLAAAGFPHILKMLREGAEDPIWNLSDALDDLLRSDTDAVEPRNPTSIAEAIRNP